MTEPSDPKTSDPKTSEPEAIDFAPLKVGNTWSYQFEITSLYKGSGYKDKGVAILRIASAESSGDTIHYLVEGVDSTHRTAWVAPGNNNESDIAT